ncbi:hypothetical protein AVEN_135351-1 [Araneus ventricosus]|uniref:Uncharacterized protein n=1 Tax=Araneus ventricosus TaxID=182803 RepID=A0A4Y2VZX6_ARAVE|nr:hypothetical protein AVEN_135351-1 [Araneus ventricosus]
MMDPSLQASQRIDGKKKEKEGRPPTPIEMDFCAKLQEQDARKITTRKRLRKARNRLKKAHPHTEIAKKIMMDIDALNEAMASVDRIIASIVECPVLSCTNPPVARNAGTRSEGDASICTDMDTSSLADDQEQATTPPGEGNADDEDFQISPQSTL